MGIVNAVASQQRCDFVRGKKKNLQHVAKCASWYRIYVTLLVILGFQENLTRVIEKVVNAGNNEHALAFAIQPLAFYDALALEKVKK